MYFGEYLVQQKTISEEQLVEVLAYQIEALPSFLRVLKNEKLLQPQQILNLVEKQIEGSCDLLTIIRGENVLTNDQINNLFKKQCENKSPLGQLLLDLKYIKSDDLEKSLNSFIALEKTNEQRESLPVENNIEQVNDLETENIDTQTEDNHIDPETGISSVALESLKALGEFNEEMVAELEGVEAKDDSILETQECVSLKISPLQNEFVLQFTNTFSEKSKKKLTKVLGFIKSTGEAGGDIANFYNSLYSDLHIIKGAARLAEAKLSEKILDQSESIIEKVFSLDNEKLKKWGDENLPLFDMLIPLLWELREKVSNGETETVLWKNEIWKQGYLALYAKMQRCLKEF